jgi:hypothetical protein
MIDHVYSVGAIIDGNHSIRGCSIFVCELDSIPVWNFDNQDGKENVVLSESEILDVICPTFACRE